MSNKDNLPTNHNYSIYEFSYQSPPPLTPPTRGGGKTFPPPAPLTEGDKGGGEVRWEC